MKNKFAIATLVTLLVIAVTMNVLIFLLVPKEIIALGSFKVVWVFTFPVNFIMAMISTVYASKKNSEVVLRVPPIMYITYVFAIIYFAVGVKMMTVHWNSVKIPLAVEIAITAVYVIILVFAILGVGYMESNQKRTQKKILYIGLLETDVKSAIPYASSEEMQTKLKKLAEKIRFSDPMSHESLASCEQEIEVAVRYIVATLRADGSADVSKKISEVEALIEYRNERCKILK